MDSRKQSWIAASFGAGLAGLLIQTVLMRELIVVFLGHELTLGFMFAIWLVSVAFGSFLGQLFIRQPDPAKTTRIAITSFALMAALPMPLMLAARSLRALFAASTGEFLPFAIILFGCAATLAPVCVIIGFLFPHLCQGAFPQQQRAVTRVYAADAFGSLIGGVIFTFFFACHVSALACMVFVLAIASASAACLLQGRSKFPIFSAAAIFAILAVTPGVLAPMEQMAAKLRWRAFGIIKGGDSDQSACFITERDSRYQNLALLNINSQATLFGNGRPLFSFPDPLTSEFTIHPAMSQNPTARRVLLIGGNPSDDIRELLRYPLETLVHVDIDEEAMQLVENLPKDPRLVHVVIDGPRYMRVSTNIFDAILVLAPAPLTLAQNRFYTTDFFMNAKKRLAAGGFFYTTLEASEHLHDETAFLGASLLRTLKSCFPKVLATAGPTLKFFAGASDSPLTLDAAELTARSRGAGIKGEFFRPEFFEQDEALDPLRVAWTLDRLTGLAAPVNTSAKPVAFRYALILWNRISDSEMGFLLKQLESIRPKAVQRWIAVICAALLVCGIFQRYNKKFCRIISARWTSTMALGALAVSGFTAMAFHLMVLACFQNLLGYMYANLGLLAAASMGGLALGAWAMRKILATSTLRLIAIFFVIQISLGLAAMLLSWFALDDASRTTVIPYWLLTGILTSMAALAGCLTGARFTVACEWLMRMGFGSGKAAAWANVADLSGAAIGSTATGLVLFSVFGLHEACNMLAVLQLAGAAAVASGAFAIRRA